MSYGAELYMHDLDRKAFTALSQFPKFLKLQAYIANVNEKVAKIEFLSTAIRLSENQLPEVYHLPPPACEKLGIDIPDLYMVQSENRKDLKKACLSLREPAHAGIPGNYYCPPLQQVL